MSDARQTVLGFGIGVALVAFMPIAVGVTELGWSHAWMFGFAGSLIILVISLLATLAMRPE